MPSQDNHDTNSNLPAEGVGRRTVAKGLAWTIPVIATGAVLPHASASECMKKTVSLQSGIPFTVPRGATGITVTVIDSSGGTGDAGKGQPGQVATASLTLDGPTAAGLKLNFTSFTGGAPGGAGTGGGGGNGGTQIVVRLGGSNKGTLSAANGGNGGSGDGSAVPAVSGSSNVSIGSSTSGSTDPSVDGTGRGAAGSGFVTYCG